MLELDPPMTGFTTWTAEGHGYGFGSASVSERVRGRVKRSIIAAIMWRTEAKALLDIIADKAAFPHLTFWTEPIDEFGQMQREAMSKTNVVFLAGGEIDKAEE